MCTNLAIDWGPHIVRMGYKTMYIYGIYTYIWVNYNSLTATEPWNHG